MFIHGLQHYCFLGKPELYGLCGLRQLSRQIWTVFLVQKRFQLLGCKTQNIQERWQQRVPTGLKTYDGEEDFNQFMRLRNQLVNAAENVAREENLTPVLIPTMSKVMDEQLKLAHKVIDVMDRANRNICVTLLRYNVDRLERSYAQVRFFARKKEDENFKQIVYVKHKLEEFIYSLDVMNSVLYNSYQLTHL